MTRGNVDVSVVEYRQEEVYLLKSTILENMYVANATFERKGDVQLLTTYGMTHVPKNDMGNLLRYNIEHFVDIDVCKKIHEMIPATRIVKSTRTYLVTSVLDEIDY